MSRSYHVTEKKASAAFCEGDLEPGYQFSEKQWVKEAQMKARKHGSDVSNRSIVSSEIASTKRVKNLRAIRFPEDSENQQDTVNES